jgi:hypothetical protein
MIDLIKDDIVKCRKDFGIEPDKIKHFEYSSSLYYISDDNIEVVLNISIVNSDKDSYKVHRKISIFKDDEQIAEMRDDSNFREILKNHFKLKLRINKLSKI